MTIKNKSYMFIRQSRHSNFYCNLVFHVETEGGWDSPTVSIGTARFNKFGGKCNCSAEDKENLIKFKNQNN